MLTAVHPKLPMRDQAVTRQYYVHHLGFEEVGSASYEGYLMVKKDQVELHFFAFPDLDPNQNYGQVYLRVEGIGQFYQALLARQVPIHPNGQLAVKPWGQQEFSLLDPDHNLLTFGEALPGT